MVSSLGGIPLANPLQNPVMTGLGQYYNAVYSPLQMMAAPLQSLAMASMYGDRGMYYQGAANKDNTQATQMQQGLSGPTGQLVNTILQQGNNSPASIAQAQAVLVAMSQQQAVQNQVGSSTVGVNAANAAKSGTEATNLGYAGTVAPTTVTPGLQPGGVVPNGVVTPTQSSQPTGLTPQGNSQGPMQALQQGLGQLSGSPGQPQTPMYATNMQPSDFLKYAASGNPTPPPLPPGTPLNPATGKLMNQLDSSQQFNDKLNNLIQNASNPNIQPFIGKDFSVAGGRRILGDVTSGLTGQSSPAFTQYQQMMQSGALSGEGLANIAAPGTKAWSAIHQNQDMLDPTKAPSAGVYIGNLKNIANMQQQDLMSIVQGNYTPAVRQRAWQQLQYTTKLPGFQQQLQSQQATPQVQQQASVFQSPDFQSAIAAELKSRGS